MFLITQEGRDLVIDEWELLTFPTKLTKNTQGRGGWVVHGLNDVANSITANNIIYI